jgi:tetratricopeptide (TPR) repeat protein
MLTLFTTCKPFEGATAIAQRNALESWRRLGHGCEVILIGDDPGTAEVAAELGLRHAPRLERTERGTPLLNSLFDTAQAIARHDLLCYVNADIVLMSDFIAAVRRLPPERVLMISRRWDVDVDEPLDFDDPDWEDRLRAHVHACGTQKGPHDGPDFFVFRRDQWPDIPPFALGRTAFDNWLIYAAITSGCPVVDSSPCVMAVHQNHDYGHAQNGWTGAWLGDEAVRNRALIADAGEAYTFLDATHLMTGNGLVPAMSPAHMARRLERRRAHSLGQQLFLANTLAELGRHDEALATITQAGQLAATPEQKGRIVRAMVPVALPAGRRDEAEALIHQLIVADPSPVFVYRIASICEESRAFELAAPLFHSLVTDRDATTAQLKAGAAFHLARIAAETGDPKSARRYVQQCLGAIPDHSAARRLLESLDERDGELGAVLTEAVRNVLADSPEGPPAVPRRVDAAD